MNSSANKIISSSLSLKGGSLTVNVLILKYKSSLNSPLSASSSRSFFVAEIRRMSMGISSVLPILWIFPVERTLPQQSLYETNIACIKQKMLHQSGYKFIRRIKARTCIHLEHKPASQSRAPSATHAPCARQAVSRYPPVGASQSSISPTAKVPGMTLSIK